MAENNSDDISLLQHLSHSRDWRDNLYVYPVISRRSKGLSIGINLNPDKACNFDCIYCQVDRTKQPRVRQVDLDILRDEIADMVSLAKRGALFHDPRFVDVPQALHRINDIAFSGDGEPTTCTCFKEAVQITAQLKREANLDATKLVLITDACYLTKPEVQAGLGILDENNGEIWAKLDAGTEAYYQRVNRPNYPLQHVVQNITDAARMRPVVIQSLFMRVAGQGPGEAEIVAYTDRLKGIIDAGGKISYVQVYTVARIPAETFVSALSDTDVDRIAKEITTRTSLRAEVFYGSDVAEESSGNS